jgi:WD40 repeat protein
VKPENMLLGGSNEVLLSDFGIAIVVQSSHYQSTKDMAGTIAYMAPEQIQAHPRPASDQYSLGVVVYEWLSGDRPFHGSFTEVAIKHSVVPPPSLREKNPTIPPTVEDIVMRALAKDPKDRFGSVQEFAATLQQDYETLLRPTVIVTPPSRPLQSIPSTQPAVVSPSVPPTVFAENKTPAAPVGQKQPVGSGNRLDITATSFFIVYSKDILAVAWSPDGKYVAVGGKDKCAHILTVATKRYDSIKPYGLFAAWVSSITWSPNGKYLALGTGISLYIYRIDTAKYSVGEYVKGFTLNDDIVSVVWSPDGKYLAAGGKDERVRIIDFATGKTTLRYDSAGIASSITWSPDGKYLAVGGSHRDAYILDVAAKKLRRIYEHTSLISCVAWSPNGKYLLLVLQW